MTGRGRGRPPVEFQNQIPAALFKDAGFKTLSAHQRLLLIAMIATADRMGRGLASAGHLWADAFVGLDVTVEQTEAMIQELPSLMAGSKFELVLYTVDRNQYYYFPRWREFQNGYEVKTSRYPDPPDDKTSPDPESPTSPQGQPDGSADLPPAPAAPTGVPTSGEAQGNAQGEGEPDRPQESADLSAIEQARRSPEYREYEEVCRSAYLDTWVTFTAFEQLFREAIMKGRDWRVLIAVAKEAITSASGKTPNVRYGLRILQEMPPEIKTREQAESYFQQRRSRTEAPEGAPPAPRRGRPPKSNIFLRREQKDESYFEHIFKKFEAAGVPGPPAEQGVT